MLTIALISHSIPRKTPKRPPLGDLRSSLLLKIAKYRLYACAIALFFTVSSFILILIGLITYEKTRASSVEEIMDPYSGREICVEIETKPNVTFAAIGGVNTLLSALLACWKSSKVSFVVQE